MAFYLGCPLWGQKTWVGNFFPKQARQNQFLSLYARRLNTVEGNTTFYALPNADLVERWRDDVPDDFRFCLKVPQTISHHKRLVNAEGETAELVDRLQRLGVKAGPTLLQLPPTFSIKQFAALEKYLRGWLSPFPLVVEPRHADFFTEKGATELNQLLLWLNMGRCEFDTRGLRSVPSRFDADVGDAQNRKPNFAPSFIAIGTTVFVRYCGHPTVAENALWLEEWATHIAAWLAENLDVYFFTHHPDDTHAPQVAALLHALVRARFPIPPLPEWGETEPTQASLF